jgi:hypothetical protein
MMDALSATPNRRRTRDDDKRPQQQERASHTLISFFLACLLCLFVCLIVCLFVSSLPSAANKGPPSRPQQQQEQLLQQKKWHLQETLQTRSGAKPRRRPVAASASCATAIGKKPSEIRQKKRPKRKRPFPRPSNANFFSRKTAFSGLGGVGAALHAHFCKRTEKCHKKTGVYAPTLH